MFKLEKQPRVKRMVKTLTTLFRSVDAKRASLNERDRLGIKADNFVYGEITFLAFAQILTFVDPQPGEVFYDLGSGAGKAIFVASLLYDFSKVCGIEFLKPLYDISVNQQKELEANETIQKHYPQKLKNIEFINADLFEQDITDANIIYVNSTCFIGEVWDRMVVKLGTVRPGTRIILNTKSLPEEHYRKIESNLYPMSWGKCTINIYEKLP